MLHVNKSGFEKQLNLAMIHVKECTVELLQVTANALDLLHLDLSKL